jgi:glycosyltransferase involved in cell wall biosynthesis
MPEASSPAQPAGAGKRLAFLLPDMRGGGAERVALKLIADFIALGHRVDLVLMAAKGELISLLPPGVRVIDLGCARIRDVILPLRRYLRREKPDAIQISMWPLTVVGILAHRLARSKARLVVSDHIMLSRQYPLGRVGSKLLGLSIGLFYPKADARVVVSKQAGDDLARLSGIPRDSIELIYNPVAIPPAGSARNAEIERLWSTNDPRILTVGSLKEQKNHKLLIRSFARLLRTKPARLMILGEGDQRGPLAELAEAEGVGDRVLMPGFAADPWPYYASADLFVLSSDYEGFGLVLVEAMRCGLPVVSTDCEAGPREILADGAYGRLVPCGDVEALAAAMLDALESPVDAKALKVRAEEISGPAASARYLELMTQSGRTPSGAAP